MRYKHMPPAEPLAEDDKKMIDAIQMLAAAGIDVRRPPNSLHQLKVSASVSYYPGSQSIFIDGEAAARPERGLDALLGMLDVKPIQVCMDNS